ncbi:MAG: hypothetical protein H6733_16765 [Alphaproteobacteria bacterium]|nr:hypothetical protein [Alphaproteobacteria bacterium]
MSDDETDFEALSRELVVELRGHQSTRAASKRLGYASNPVLRWERGERVPPADDVLRFAHLQGREVVGAARMLTNAAVAVLGDLTPRDPGFVPAIVQVYADFLGRATLAELTGHSLQQLGRLIRGETRMRLPALLHMMQTVNQTMVRFLDTISDLTRLPSAHTAWVKHDRETALMQDMPFVFPVLYALELGAYRQLPAHDDAWLATLLGLPESDVVRSLARLAHLDMIVERDGRWVPTGARHGATRHRWPEAVERQVSAALIDEAARRIRGGLATSAWEVFRVGERGVRVMASELARALESAADITSTEHGGGERIGYAMVLLVPMDGRKFNLREDPSGE